MALRTSRPLREMIRVPVRMALHHALHFPSAASRKAKSGVPRWTCKVARMYLKAWNLKSLIPAPFSAWYQAFVLA